MSGVAGFSRALGVALGSLAAAAPIQAQYDARSFTVRVTPDTATVGDTVRLRFRLLLSERDLLTDTLPRPTAELPAGTRLLSVEKMTRGTDRAFTGEAALAFYRPGLREIPSFGVPWVQIVTGHRGVVASEGATVVIAPVLPGGNPALRDIREPEVPRTAGLLPAIIVAAGATLAWYLVRRRRRRRATDVSVSVPAAPPEPPDAYAMAMVRLDDIEREGWAGRGDVERHYEAVVDTLRDYLEAAEEIPARERTSTELLWTLPPRLHEGGLRRLTGHVLQEADLVKFARRRPEPAAAADHLRDARELLRRWHEAGASNTLETADAAR